MNSDLEYINELQADKDITDEGPVDYTVNT